MVLLSDDSADTAFYMDDPAAHMGRCRHGCRLSGPISRRAVSNSGASWLPGCRQPGGRNETAGSAGGRQRSKGQWRRASGHRPPPGECDVWCDCRTDFDRSRVCNRRDAASPSTRSERRPSRRSAQLWNFPGAGKRTATTAPDAPSGRSRISIEPPWAVTT